MNEVKAAISKSFLSSFIKVPRSAQKKVVEFLHKFEKNPRSTGINYEKIHVKDKSMRSVRISDNHRAIISKPKFGNIFILLWVDNHDAAYEWAKRHCNGVNATTGTLQVYESPVDKPPESKNNAAADSYSPHPEVPPLFSFTDDQFLSLGVPPELLSVVKSVTSDEGLEMIENQLPADCYEALYMAAAGDSWADMEQEYVVKPNVAIDPDDVEAALERSGSRRSFYVLENDGDLKRILESPLDMWRIFLHPSQRALVDRNWNGPVRVLGGAGTGKTVVALHRARWLAQELIASGRSGKVLFTTFTSNLALDIENNLRKICNSEEFLRIDVVHVDRWITEFLHRNDYQFRVILADEDREYHKIWGKALQKADSSVGVGDSFFKEEWKRVILPQRISSRSEYLLASRVGRGVPLNRRQRLKIWPVFDAVRSGLNALNLRTFEDATHDAGDILRDKASSEYISLVCDETQDMGSEVLTLLRQLVAEGDNDLFFVGDGHQRIYRNKAVMSHCGVDIVGRGRKLRINYRTTEEIKNFAVSVLEDVGVDDLDGSTDSIDNYRSLTRGHKPIISENSSAESEATFISKEIGQLQKNGIELKDICVVVRTKKVRSELAALLESLNVKTHSLEQFVDNRETSGVRLATMHRVKGLEFRYIFIAAVNDGLVPLDAEMRSTEDPVEARARELNERALLHVAASRAISGLYVSSSGPKSALLKNE